ncbi:MAG: precorrin-6y C5,15-methyltransferase (decarboxylating) subunit CbiE [Rhodobacter sp.]|nr:precorrin-6y C5,15-methyltransferase (decarboxylating) subunit CbiE [Rhodobacter sp.]
MGNSWLHIVGIGEDGMRGLSPIAREVVENAEIIFGGDRHHRLSRAVTAERIAWPSPFGTLIDRLVSYRGRRVVVLATGDPLWYSVGARIGRSIPPEQITYHPQLSAFQLAAARLGWSLADVETLTVHGRPVEQVIPFIQPNQRLLILTTGEKTPSDIAHLLTERGFGKSAMTALACMGGDEEQRFDGIASEWRHRVPAFNTLAVRCEAAPDASLLPCIAGLSDDQFEHDGVMTKQEVRAITLAKLMPMRGALLWDIGIGCGSVAIEWMRASREAKAVGIEPNARRRAIALRNAARLGAPGLQIVEGMAPAALRGLQAPDAVFIGGGLTAEVFNVAWASLRPIGRLVANAVTLETEARILELRELHGGQLARIAVSRASPVGNLAGWRPLMPVTQWSLVKK